MRKNEFINAIRGSLRGYPHNEVENSIEFYSEIIDDRVENGMTEEEAVASLGDLDMIIKNIKVDMPLKSVIKERVKENKEERIRENKHMSAGFVFYMLLWVFDIVIFAVSIALAACLAGGVIGGVINFIAGNPGTGIAFIGVGIAALGLAIFLFMAGTGVAKANVSLTGSFLRGTKRKILRA